MLSRFRLPQSARNLFLAVLRHTPAFPRLMTSQSTPSTPRGAFIVFEGLDRSGKSTQCQMLKEYLERCGYAVKRMGFPERSTPIGQQIDAYLRNKADLDDKVLHNLFSQNRWEFKDEIYTTLQSGITLIVDRYAYSGCAYSSAKGLDLAWCKQADAGLPAPDVVFFLDLPPTTASTRGQYGEERYEKVAFQEKVGKAFKQLVGPNWVVLDAQRSKEELHRQIAEEALQVLEECKYKKVSTLW